MISRAASGTTRALWRVAVGLLALSAPGCLLVDPPAPVNHAANGAGGEVAGISGGEAVAGDANSPGASGAGGASVASGGSAGAAPDADAGEAGIVNPPSDACTGIVCNTPPASGCVSPSEFKGYDAVGTCVDGVCNYRSNPVACTCQGDACTTDPCANLTCATPPAGACTDANTQRAYTATGTCSAGSCSYAATDMACSFGCSNGVCNPDPCGLVTCNAAPVSACSGSTLTAYDASGSCNAGHCSYKSTDTSCAFGCAGGACKPDPCIGVSCKTPPAGSCVNATTFKTYDSTGSCAGGTCTYASESIPCTCSGNACSTDPCIGVACNAPPAATCKDASTQRKYASAGTCSAGSCSYAPTDTACAFGCASGACKPDPCASVTCKTPPAALCKNTTTLTTYASSGTCSGGSCSYKATDSSCAFGCANGACKPDPCASVTCKTPPASTCAGSTQTSYAATGTCSAGTCSYSPSSTSCAFGCGSTGKCKPDPCAGITCNNGGSCNSSAGGTCSCTSRFNGAHCEYQVFRGLGVPSGDDATIADGISRDGSVALAHSLASGSLGTPYDALRSLSGGALQAIAEITGLTVQAGCQPAAVDGAGTVVGTCETTTPFQAASSNQATRLSLGQLTGSAIVRDISQSGKVVVGYYLGAGTPVAFRSTSSATTLLPPLATGTGAYASATNSDGSLVVGWGDDGTAWRWSSQTGSVALANVSGLFDSANDISTDGKVIVGSDGQNCVRWSGASFSPVLLGAGVCNATSSGGSVSVGSDYDTTIAMVWNATGAHTLASLLGSTSDLSGWTLALAVGVSDDGKFVIGSGYNAGAARSEAWLAHLP